MNISTAIATTLIVCPSAANRTVARCSHCRHPIMRRRCRLIQTATPMPTITRPSDPACDWECCAPNRRPPPVGGVEDQRQSALPVGHVPGLGDLVRDDVPAGCEEVTEHQLADQAKARHRGAHHRPGDRLLGDRRVHDPFGTDLLEQPFVVLDTPPAAAMSSPSMRRDQGVVSRHRGSAAPSRAAMWRAGPRRRPVPASLSRGAGARRRSAASRRMRRGRTGR